MCMVINIIMILTTMMVIINARAVQCIEGTQSFSVSARANIHLKYPQIYSPLHILFDHFCIKFPLKSLDVIVFSHPDHYVAAIAIHK